MDVLVETRGLTKRYGRRIVAVDGLDLSVRRGEVYGFLGPNGAGKTTTMRLLLGYIRPTSGSAVVAGHPPGHPKGLARLGALVESPAFFPYLSGRDNLRVFARYAGVGNGRVDETLGAVDLLPRAEDKFAVYSLGMKQRLGVAAALLKDPELLILDEPTNGLDPAGIVDMRRLIRRLGGEGRTVLLSSHDLGEVEQVCGRVGVIRGGRLAAEGTVAELRGGVDLLIRAAPIAEARRRLEAMLGEDRVRVEGDALLVRAVPESAPALLTALVDAGVEVMELTRTERPLEEVFLELTEGKSAGAESVRGEVR